DLGAVHAGGLGVTLYATLAPEQIAYVAADCDARIAVLDGAAELARWRPILEQLPGITKIIVRDRAACPAGDRYMTWADFAALGRNGSPPSRVRSRPGWRRSSPVTRWPCCTPRAPPATPRESCSRTATSFTRWLPSTPWASSSRVSAGSPICRWRTSPSACSASTRRFTPSATSISALTPRSSCGGSGKRDLAR